MKKVTIKKSLIALALASSLYSCKKNQNNPLPVSSPYNISQTNLVSNVASANAAKTDTNLANAWGLAANPTGAIWVSSNHKSLSTVYDSTGQTVNVPVIIPAFNAVAGTPTGIVYNGTQDFRGAVFIFAGENGAISAWANGNVAVTVAGAGAPDAVYKGLTIGNDAGSNFLYAANLKTGKVEVFDKGFDKVTNKPFTDPAMPAGFVPFNIQNIGGMLYVTYAKQKGPDNVNDDPAPGNGYVDIFKPDGTFVKRFASNGTLNSPWGITHAPAGFAAATETILVGNFGDGKINVFDLTGNYKGQLQSNGQALVIEGLWALDFLKASPTAVSKLYFTAGPGGESQGILGYLKNSSINNAGAGSGSTGNSGSGSAGSPGY
jgi:uncharacterized protein (TIGR03118 family)